MNRPRLVIEPGRTLRGLKPVNGVNNGPFCLDGVVDLTPEFRAARFADVRTHDCNYPARDVCDISAVFPRFDADPQDPASYDFARTDHYLRTIREVGCSITYRLGYTIDHHPVKRYCHPPADFQKFAQICLGIARHYNEGWAGGFHDWVARWEVWNEPDNSPGPQSPCWTGTLEQFVDLYEIIARTLKRHNPKWQVGGPGAGGVFSTPILELMMKRLPASGAPLDFYSWHTYENRPQEVLRLATHIRQTLDKAGFTAAQCVLNEWHSGPNLEWDVIMRMRNPPRRLAKAQEMNGTAAASYTAAALIVMQDGPVDLANYYTADIMFTFGMFDQYGAALPPYHAFTCFAELLDTPTQVAVERGDVPDTTYALATRDEAGNLAVMLVNDTPRPTRVELAVAGAANPRWTLHGGFGWPSLEGSTLILPAHAFVCVKTPLT